MVASEPVVNAADVDPAEPAIRLRNPVAPEGKAVFEVVGLGKTELEMLQQTQPSPERWPQIFAVYVENLQRAGAGEPVPILGSYWVDERTVQFEPQFPLQRGLDYRAVYQFKFDMELPSDEGSTPRREHRQTGPITARISIPKPPAEATASLVQVYPSAAELPENTLKFYLHFSAPMSRGEAYRRIHLLDDSGEEVPSPFLELDEELWDRSGKRFTLFFEPGRIKRGLKPREEVGPVLEEDKSYTLVVDREWPDAAGNPLRESFRQKFHVGPPDDQQPDPNTWQVRPPPAGTTEPLVITFPEPLDHAMLHRVIVVRDSADKLVEGQIRVDEHETRWSLTPATEWQSGDFTIEVQTDLEDRSGNSIARVFEVDLAEPISRSMKAEAWSLPFRIVAP